MLSDVSMANLTNTTAATLFRLWCCLHVSRLNLLTPQMSVCTIRYDAVKMNLFSDVESTLAQRLRLFVLATFAVQHGEVV